ncbi:hypothetical protein TSUD_378380 [Trifolium subterraneum]|uniref:Uncharacterized protein n=1 Tax=Trifolium subterraneum TaxID=3900 RepID=A0A2Z6NRA5_TRISU|nr:hypothetical protein TSUD_378380 [Trifolium subterraneum]
MSSDEVDPVFVSWEEELICQERGNRVIHFYLRDMSGNSVLAVVGTERSVRHMMLMDPPPLLINGGQGGRLLTGLTIWFRGINRTVLMLHRTASYEFYP